MRIHFSFQTTLALVLTLTLFACQHGPERIEHIQSNDFDIIDFNVSLTPNIETGEIFGAQKIVLKAPVNPASEISFSSGNITIMEALVNGHQVMVRRIDDEFVIPINTTINTAQQPREFVEIALRYSANSIRGYTVAKSYAHSEYFSCDWMVCQQENFGDKATITLNLNLPHKMDTLGPGRLVESTWLENGLYRSTWRSDVAFSPYLYAFAYGDFVTTTQKIRNVTLKYVSAVADENTLHKLFAPTADMLNFFEEKAGVAFQNKEYTQFYVAGGSAQEAASHSIIGEKWLKPILDEPTEDWLIAHELAHQWWGNGVTCTHISEFWLNEGITTFMVAAWKEHRWGRAMYERELQFARKRHQKAVDAGMDVPLAFKGKYPSLKIRRAIQYSKGAIFMDVLRSEIGDEAFWLGLRDFTRSNMGKTVSSIDLQSAFEQATKRDLSFLFDEWVYGSNE